MTCFGSIHHGSPLRRRGLAAVATGVTLLLTAAAGAPALAMPADPEPAAVTGAPVAATTHTCFIGQTNWPADAGRQPQCTVAERLAGRPST
jgi:hypothetical protein